MAPWILNSFQWLSFAAFRKFFDPKELVAFILPTTYAYYDAVPKLIDCSRPVIIVTACCICLILMSFNIYKKFNEHEQAIAEVLETGYFSNFFDRTAVLLDEKRQRGEMVTVLFKNNTAVQLDVNKILVKITLPKSKQQLSDTVAQIDAISRDATLDNGIWVKAAEHADGSVTVYECPRTLKAISRYLVNGQDAYTEENSFRLHRYFNERFMKDWDSHEDSIPQSIFKVNSVFEA